MQERLYRDIDLGSKLTRQPHTGRRADSLKRVAFDFLRLGQLSRSIDNSYATRRAARATPADRHVWLACHSTHFEHRHADGCLDHCVVRVSHPETMVALPPVADLRRRKKQSHESKPRPSGPLL